MGILDPVGGLLEGVLGENTMANIPGVSSLFGSQSDAEKNLLKKQSQLAAEAKAQQDKNQKARMQALGQSMLAFNPRNQVMAQMFGPEAAFSPEQFAQMGQSPFGPPELPTAPGQGPSKEAMGQWAFNGQKGPMPQGSGPESLVGYQGTDPAKQALVEEYLKKKKEYEAQQKMIQMGMSPVGPGPAALGPRANPAAARRF